MAQSFDINNPASSPQFVRGTPEWVQPIIARAAQKHNIPPMILSALLKQESGFNPHAKSPVGATGIAQFMPGTASGMGVDPLDPESAIDGAARYLRSGLDKFGKIDLALAAYNAGGGAVSQYGGIPPYKETQNYVKNILAMAGEPHETSNQLAMNFIAEAHKQAQNTVKEMMPKSPEQQQSSSMQLNQAGGTPQFPQAAKQQMSQGYPQAPEQSQPDQSYNPSFNFNSNERPSESAMGQTPVSPAMPSPASSNSSISETSPLSPILRGTSG